MCESGELQQPAPQAHCRHALLQSGVAWVLGSEIIYDSVCSYATMSESQPIESMVMLADIGPYVSFTLLIYL